MGAAKKLIDKKVLRTLVPINALSAIHLEEISKKAIIEDVRSGTYVFKRGDRDYQTVFLLDGKVELVDEKRELVGTVVAGSESARHPLANKQPRQLGVRASGKVTVARIDSSLLDVLLTWDESSGYDVQEIDAQDDDDWMTRMLQSQAFLQLPPSNIHQLLMRLESVSASAGDVVVRQGEDGDYFYVVKTGRLAVTRKASARSKEVLLAELGEGACFGEEALVSGTKRNASVMMITDGSLMRLSKTDFNELLCASLVHEADYEGAQKLVAEGAKWLDVRLPGEFANQAIKGSANLPLSALREQCQELDSDTDYILCCDTGRRSAAGAFVLSQRGFNVYTLKNGLMDVPDDALTSQGVADGATPVKDADIIPFDSESGARNAADSESATDSDESPQADAVLIDKIAESEADKLALEKQLDEVTEERDVAHRQLEELNSEQRAYQADLDKFQADIAALKQQLSEVERQSVTGRKENQALLEQIEERNNRIEVGKHKLKSVETEKQCLQDELTGLQQTISQIQSSSEGRDDALRKELESMSARIAEERQLHSRQSAELQDELAKIRNDYTQLGQRTSQVAGERDAAVGSLEELKAELSDSRRQLETAGEEAQRLAKKLADADERANRESSNVSELQTQLQQVRDAADVQLEEVRAELGAEASALLEQVNDLGKQLEAVRSTAGGDLEALKQRNESVQQELEAERKQHVDKVEQNSQLEQQLTELRQQLDAAGQEAGEQQEQIRTEAAKEQADLVGQLEDLQREAADSQQQVKDLQESQVSLEAQLGELQQQVQEKDRQLQQMETDFQQQREEETSDNESLRSSLDESQARVEALDSELNSERERFADAGKRIAEIEAQLASKDKDHELDIASTREAMSRVQSEAENIKREQARLMETKRKLQRDLERERHDHESEVYRLRKELKDVAGESGAGLEAEFDALQEKIKQDALTRDDLEIKLGERSAQLEEFRSDIEKLTLQLAQAQGSARQAEQQLLETTRQANEEMAVRMEAEEKAQAALRDELAVAIGERNQSQEQITVTQHELEELRSGLEAANRDLAETRHATSALEEKVGNLSAERDAALESEAVVQQELDRLRAEAEVTRGLVDMQMPASEADDLLREELAMAKKNVDVAVRLRAQSEERVGELEAELEEFRSRLSTIESQFEESPAGHIPSLDQNDPSAASVLTPEYPVDDSDDDQGVTVLLEDEESVTELPVAPGSMNEPTPSSGRKGLVASALAVLLVFAGAGYWWFYGKGAASFDVLPSRLSVADSAGTMAASGSVADSGTDNKPQAVGKEEAPILPLAHETQALPVVKPLPDVEGVSAQAVKMPEPDAPAVAEEAVDGSNPKTSTQKPRVIPNFARGGSDRLLDNEIPRGNGDSGSVDASEETSPDLGGGNAENTAPVRKVAKPQPVRTYSQPLTAGGRGPTLVELQADSFTMGSSSASANFDERPQHTVNLRSFSISKREITFDEYNRFATDTGRRRPGDEGWGRGQRPVINVSWRDAVAYTRWLSEQTGSQYRLPTEAEWEFAASAGSDARFWWGNDVGSQYANCFNCGSEWSGVKTAPAGSFSASAFGVQDMLGNVMEWVQDCYRKDYREAPTDGSAVLMDGGCEKRVVRGGGFDSPADSLRSANRDFRIETSRLNNLGFRVVRVSD